MHRFLPSQEALREATIHMPHGEFDGGVLWLLPTKMHLQPVDEGEVADTLVEHATAEPSGWLEPMGGPEVHRVGELPRPFRSVRETSRTEFNHTGKPNFSAKQSFPFHTRRSRRSDWAISSRYFARQVSWTSPSRSVRAMVASSYSRLPISGNSRTT